jgi:hypothetical protein
MSKFKGFIIDFMCTNWLRILYVQIDRVKIINSLAYRVQ